MCHTLHGLLAGPVWREKDRQTTEDGAVRKEASRTCRRAGRRARVWEGWGEKARKQEGHMGRLRDDVR